MRKQVVDLKTGKTVTFGKSADQGWDHLKPRPATPKQLEVLQKVIHARYHKS